MMRETLAHRLRLRTADVGQGRIRLALHAPLAVPRGFAVANQNQFSHFFAIGSRHRQGRMNASSK